jgi:hypothetical protein
MGIKMQNRIVLITLYKRQQEAKIKRKVKDKLCFMLHDGIEPSR